MAKRKNFSIEKIGADIDLHGRFIVEVYF